jgi:hypothetical protein
MTAAHFIEADHSSELLAAVQSKHERISMSLETSGMSFSGGSSMDIGQSGSRLLLIFLDEGANVV